MSATVAEGELLWEPSAAFKDGSVLAEYMRWLAQRGGPRFEDYNDLWRWSVADEGITIRGRPIIARWRG